MNYEIRIPSLNLDFTVPPSKSVVHRELIIGFLEVVKASGGREASGVPVLRQAQQPLKEGQSKLLYPPVSFKMVDTCAGEFAAETPYFYSTTNGDNEAAMYLEERSI